MPIALALAGWLIEVLLHLALCFAFCLVCSEPLPLTLHSVLLSRWQQRFLLGLPPLHPLSCQRLTQPKLCANGWGVQQGVWAPRDSPSYSSLNRVHRVPPQLTTLAEAICAGEARTP